MLPFGTQAFTICYHSKVVEATGQSETEFSRLLDIGKFFTIATSQSLFW
jgi:hypothetical protein